MKNLSLKVALGYISIIILFIGTTYYINHQATIFISSNEYEDSIHIRRATSNHLISLIIESEALGQTASIGDKSSLNSYLSRLNHIDSVAASLCALSSDSSKLLIDSLSNTIHYKAIIVKNLHDLSNKNTANTYQQQINDLIAKHNYTTSTTNTITTIIREKEAITIESPKKNVMKRIAAVFKPGDTDTTNVTTSTASTSDTISQSETKTTNLESSYNRINSKAIRQKARQINQFKNNIETLRAESSKLSLKISLLINDIEQTEQAIRQQAINKERETREKSIITTIIIAIIATTLAIVFFIIIWRDITRSNRYRREMEAAKQKAEDLLVTREKLMLTITHDIKAPAGAIKGYAELIEQSNPTDNISGYSQNIYNSASHLLNLATALLEYHKLDNNDIAISTNNFHLATNLDNIAKTFIPSAQKKGLDLDINLSPTTNCAISCDEFKLRQITENLLSNAIKFTDNGCVSLSAHIIENILTITVKDTGKGFDEDERELIFEEFSRLKNARGIEGSGLGLSIVSKLVSLLNGDITLSSQPDNGSTFHISIPISIIDCHSTYDTTKDNTDIQKCLPPTLPHILNITIIDDDPVQLKYAQSILLSINDQWHISCCHTAEDGLESITSGNPDIVFTDINMPHINGVELMRRQKQSHPATPIIALSANNNLEEYISLGFSGILQKPYNRQQLIDIIQMHVPTDNIDLSSITQFADDDEATKSLLLTTTLNESVENGKIIKNAIKEKDKATICSIAHKMLPLISMIKISGIDAFEYFNSQRDNDTWDSADDKHAQTITSTISRLIIKLKENIG